MIAKTIFGIPNSRRTHPISRRTVLRLHRDTARFVTASALTGVLALTTVGLAVAVDTSTASAVTSTVALPAPYRHFMSISHDAREIDNPEKLILPISSRSVRLVLPDPTLEFSAARFRAFGANFDVVGSVPLNRETHSVSIPLPTNFFAITADHRPLDGLVTEDPADYYGIELTGIGDPGVGPPPSANVPTGPPSVQFLATLIFRAAPVTSVTAPSFDLRWDRERPWGLFDGRSSTHGEVTWVPTPQRVWVGDRVIVTATPGYFVQGISQKYFVEAAINVNRSDAPPLGVPVPFVISPDGSTMTLTVPDAIRQQPIGDIVPRIDISLTDGLETYETILVFIPLVLTAPDTVPGSPTLTSRTPSPGARIVNAGVNVTAVFNEPVSGVSADSFTLRSTAGLVPAQVRYAATSRVATLDPEEGLQPDRRHSATLSGIRDLAGNPLAPQTWSFITGPAPTITGVSPRADAGGVPLWSSVSARVSEPVLGVSDRTVKITVAATGARVSATVSFDAASRTITVTPTANLALNTRYRASITGGPLAVRDLAGNPLKSQSMFFTTSVTP